MNSAGIRITFPYICIKHVTKIKFFRVLYKYQGKIVNTGVVK
jgi:hypothetical protein